MSETEVTPVEIARMAGVGRAAVSNWRRRYDDFPQPVDGTATNPRFVLAEVEAWLRRQGKLTESPAEELAWQHLRGWSAGDDLPAAVRHAGELLDSSGVGEQTVEGAEATLRHALAKLAAEHGPAGAFEVLLQRLHDAIRLPQTPAAVGDLMAALIGPDPATIYVPACSTGALLLAAAGRFPRARLCGEESDQALRELTRLRLTRHGVTQVDLRPGGLRQPPVPAVAADAVLCAPPSADRDWDPAVEDMAYDPRWQYGLPPRTEPELAWVQHALANLRPGGRAVLLLPPAVAARASGRRVRAELLRRGALRAVIGLPAGVAPPYNLGLHLWLLRRPASENSADRLLVADLTSREEEPGARWTERTTALLEAVAAMDSNREPAPAPGFTFAALRVMDLLDDAVDFTPSRRLRTDPPPADPAGIIRLRDRLDEQLGRLHTLLPAVLATPRPHGPSMITIADLARAGAVTITRSPAREEPGAGRPTADSVPVWRARDVVVGAGPAGQLAAADVPMDAVRVKAGDVVVPIIGHQLTARVATEHEAGALLGPTLSLLRPDPDMLDAWFLAGFLRRDSNTHRAGSLGSVSRYDVRRAEVPRIPVEDQRPYGDLFRQLTEYDAILNAVISASGDLLRGVTDGLAAGTLQLGNRDDSAA